MSAGDRIAGPGQLQFRDLLLGGTADFNLTKLVGWEDMPPVDIGSRLKPRSPGADPGLVIPQAHTVTATFDIDPLKAGGTAAARAFLRAQTAPPADALLEPIAVSLDPGVFKIRYGQLKARNIPISLGYESAIRDAVLQWECPDPRLYSSTLRSVPVKLPIAAPASQTVRTNLATNPSFEAAAGTVDVRANLCTNPSFEVDTAGWAVAGTGPTIARSTVQKYAGAASLLLTFATAGVAADAAAARFTATTVVGKTYTWSAYVYVPAGNGPVWANIGGVISPASTVTDAWQRLSATFTATATSTICDIRNADVTTANQIVYIDGALLEDSPVLGAYFDGATPAAGDFTYAWSGTADASISYQRAPGVAGVTGQASSSIQSAAWASSGSKSIRNVPTSNASASFPGGTGLAFGMVAGKTYTARVKLRLAAPQAGTLSDYARRLAVFNVGTLIARTGQAPNLAGVHDLSLTFTVPDGATSAYIVLYNGAPTGNDVWWDDLLVEESQAVQPYFDGSWPSGANLSYAWTGAANASASTETNSSNGVYPQSYPFNYAGSIAGGGPQPAVNGGNSATPPVYTITGPATAPGITINDAGGSRRIVFNLQLAAGEQLVIDVLNRTVTLGIGGASRYGFSSGVPIENLYLLPGTSTISLDGTGNTTTTLTVAYRDADI